MALNSVNSVNSVAMCNKSKIGPFFLLIPTPYELERLRGSLRTELTELTETRTIEAGEVGPDGSGAPLVLRVSSPLVLPAAPLTALELGTPAPAGGRFF